MVYTLTNAAVLGWDLVRRRGGGEVAAVLRRAGAASARSGSAAPLDWNGLAGLPAHPDRSAALGAVGAAQAGARDLVTVMATLRAAVAGGAAGLKDAAPSLTRALQTVALGTGDDLAHLVRNDLLEDVPEAAADRVLDAVLAAWAADDLTVEQSLALGFPWRTWSATFAGRAEDYGPTADQVLAIVALVERLNSRHWPLLHSVQRNPDVPWSVLMHQACWAAHLSGRLLPTFLAQMLAVEALHRAGIDPTGASNGGWEVVSGAVQAASLADVLDEGTADALHRPWHLATVGLR